MIALVLASAACGAATSGEQLTAAVADAPAEIRADCQLAADRCSRCHTLDRVVNAPATEPAFWRTYVRRMRLTPGSGIRPDEESPILRCLLYRSFGAAAVAPAPETP